MKIFYSFTIVPFIFPNLWYMILDERSVLTLLDDNNHVASRTVDEIRKFHGLLIIKEEISHTRLQNTSYKIGKLTRNTTNSFSFFKALIIFQRFTWRLFKSLYSFLLLYYSILKQSCVKQITEIFMLYTC